MRAGMAVVSVLRCGSGAIFFSHSGGAAVKPPGDVKLRASPESQRSR